jgi:hypothetical protein
MKLLRHLDNILKTWSDPPTFVTKVSFDALHGNQVKDIRQKIVRHQLDFVVVLGEAVVQREEEEFALQLSLRLSSAAGDCKAESALQVSPIADARDHPLGAKIKGGVGQPNPKSTELVDFLLALPRTMRLSHLVQALQDIQALAPSSTSPELSSFTSDIGSILPLAKELDQRLLSENHFSKDVITEL